MYTRIPPCKPNETHTTSKTNPKQVGRIRRDEEAEAEERRRRIAMGIYQEAPPAFMPVGMAPPSLFPGSGKGGLNNIIQKVRV